MDQKSLLFSVLMAMVLIWFAMLITLFKRLRSRHPEKYKSLGEPSLFWNNSMKTGWSTMKFLFKREHKILGDNFLTKLSDSMIVFITIYTILFFGLVFFIMSMSG